jgi:hypothetical protein
MSKFENICRDLQEQMLLMTDERIGHWFKDYIQASVDVGWEGFDHPTYLEPFRQLFSDMLLYQNHMSKLPEGLTDDNSGQ